MGGKIVYALFNDGMLVGSDADGDLGYSFGDGFASNIKYVAIQTKCNAWGRLDISYAGDLEADIDKDVGPANNKLNMSSVSPSWL